MTVAGEEIRPQDRVQSVRTVAFQIGVAPHSVDEAAVAVEGMHQAFKEVEVEVEDMAKTQEATNRQRPIRTVSGTVPRILTMVRMLDMATEAPILLHTMNRQVALSSKIMEVTKVRERTHTESHFVRAGGPCKPMNLLSLLASRSG